MYIFAGKGRISAPMSKTGDKIFKYALDKGRSVKNTL